MSLLPLLASATILLALGSSPGAHAATLALKPVVTGTVKDSLGRALVGVSVELDSHEGARVAATRSDASGAFSFTEVRPGTYAVVARAPDFKAASAITPVAADRPARVSLVMESEKPLSLELSAARLRPARNAVSPGGTTTYRFSREAISDLPLGQNSTINQVLIQAPGMIQDSTGQPLPREMDDSLQYRINGVMIPNVQVLDLGRLSPRFAESIDVLTGSLPAQYGYRTGAVVDIHTRSGDVAHGGSVEYFGGQRETTQPTVEYGGSQGSLSYFATGYFLHDVRGVNPPTPGPDPLNDSTNQGASFVYLSHLIDANTSLNLIGMSFVHDFGWPARPGQPQVYDLAGVPVYPSAKISDTELEQTHLGILALKGVASFGIDYQISLFSQYSSLSFHPDVAGELIYDGLAAKVFRSSFVNGSQGDATWRAGGGHTLSFGYYFNVESAEIDDHAFTFPASEGHQTSDLPVRVVDDRNLVQAVYGLYLQDRWRALSRLTIDYGLRWDQMMGFIRGSQVSPRLAVSYDLEPGVTTLHAGAAVYFVPPPTEFLATEDLDRFLNTTAEPAILENSPPKPMTDDLFDIGIRRSFPFRLQLGVDGFFELERDALDEGQFGSSLIFVPVNYRRGRIYGAEATASYDSPGSLSAYFNFAYTVAQANQVVSGQFNFEPDEFAYIAKHYVSLDQGQLFTASAGLAYRWLGFVASTAITFGSGLRTGFANTGMMPPYAQVDASVGRSFGVPGVGRVDSRLSVVNLFDRIYQFHNGSGIGVGSVPQYMARRALYFAVKLPLPGGR